MAYSSEADVFSADAASVAKKSQRRRMFVNLCLLACSVVFSFVVAESLIRVYYPIGDSIWTLDKRYLHRHIPNSRRIYRFSAANGGKSILVTINREGRRGDLVSMNRPHILVYGDSFISATFVPVEQTFVWQLEQKLKPTLTPAPQVVNCGVSGYGPDQESLVLQDQIDSLKPELVIVAIYSGNDFGDLLRDKIYQLDSQGQLRTNQYVLDPSLVSQFESVQHLPQLYTVRLLQKAWQHLVESRSSALTATGIDYTDAWLRDSRAEYQEYIVNGNNNVHNLFEDHYDADVSLTPNSESARYKRLLMTRVIERLQQITSARSVPLMLLIIPSPIDVVDNYSVSVDVRRYPEYRRSELTDVVENIARTHQIPYVNLFEPFRQYGAGSLYYIIDNDHWNAKGQELAAGIVEKYIMRRHLLDSEANRQALAQQ